MSNFSTFRLSTPQKNGPNSIATFERNVLVKHIVNIQICAVHGKYSKLKWKARQIDGLNWYGANMAPISKVNEPPTSNFVISSGIENITGLLLKSWKRTDGDIIIERKECFMRPQQKHLLQKYANDWRSSLTWILPLRDEVFEPWLVRWSNWTGT